MNTELENGKSSLLHDQDGSYEGKRKGGFEAKGVWILVALLSASVAWLALNQNSQSKLIDELMAKNAASQQKIDALTSQMQDAVMAFESDQQRSMQVDNIVLADTTDDLMKSEQRYLASQQKFLRAGLKDLLSEQDQKIAALQKSMKAGDSITAGMRVDLYKVMGRLRTTGFSLSDAKTMAYCPDPTTDSCNSFSSHIEW